MIKANTKMKILIMLALSLLTVCLLSTRVRATTDEEKKAILNVIPDSIKLDIKEIEYAKANEIIKSNIEKKLKDAGFNNLTIDVFICDYMNVDDFYKANISVYYNKEELAKKDISLSYSNSNNKSSVDEQYIKNIKLESPQYYEVDISDINKDNTGVLGMAKKYYQNKIKDNTITVITTSGASSGDTLSVYTHGTNVLLFKDDILYDIKSMGDEFTVCSITVPNNVSDNEEYAIKQLNNLFGSYGQNEKITKLEKDNTFNNPNMYKAYYTDGSFSDSAYVIIKKAEKIDDTKLIEKIDTITKIKLDTTTAVIPENTKLVAEEVKSGDNYNTVVKVIEKEVSKFVLYDINLMHDNAKIQPNGKVKISIPVPEGYNTSKIVVYRIAEDGTKTKYDTTINDGYITFETDHFSNYVVAEETERSTVNETISNENKLDNEPKTGEVAIKLFIGIGLVAFVVLIVNNKKRNKEV